MSVTFFIGPMFSGKTTEVCTSIERARYAAQSCVLIKYIHDNRYSKDLEVCTHSLRKIKSEKGNKDFGSLRVVKSSCLSDIKILESERYIGIDEGQFYPDLLGSVMKWLKQGKRIFIAALNGDFECKPFATVSNTLPLATHIIHLKAVCMLCRSKNYNPVDAQFTIRTTEDKKIEVIGSNDIYKAACVNCMIAHTCS